MTDQQTTQATITDTALFESDTVLTIDREAIIAEAVAVIDGALANMLHRDLVSSIEVADLLLDVRSLLTAKH
ncbi:MAG TPA: hypothetical protein VIS05_01755 [Ilumatobacter sp.]